MTHIFTQTEDGSTTIYIPELNEHYHSIHGAVQESEHIFIRAGISYYLQEHPSVGSADSPLRILEAGFGTGLNAYLTLLCAREQNIQTEFYSLEKYPLSEEEVRKLNYKEYFRKEDPGLFDSLHQCDWNQTVALTPFFSLYKSRTDFREIDFNDSFDIVFFDAFNPEVQPHLWTEEIFNRFYRALKSGGLFVTYCVKGTVKQNLRKAGFTLKRLPGPPGKREMLRGTKQEKIKDGIH